MIIKEIFYGLKCDRCGEQFENYDGAGFYPDEDSVIEFASECEWIEKDGKNYCPGCYATNEKTDEIEISDPIPNHIKKIRSFVKNIVRSYCNTKEGTESFQMLFVVPVSTTLNPCDENFIRSYLGDKLISLVYTGDFMSTECIIEIKK